MREINKGCYERIILKRRFIMSVELMLFLGFGAMIALIGWQSTAIDELD